MGASHVFWWRPKNFLGSAEMGLISSGGGGILSVPERYRSDTQATGMRLRPIKLSQQHLYFDTEPSCNGYRNLL